MLHCVKQIYAIPKVYDIITKALKGVNIEYTGINIL